MILEFRLTIAIRPSLDREISQSTGLTRAGLTRSTSAAHTQGSLDFLLLVPHQEKLFNNLRRGDRGTPQRLAPRHCDARAEPPERSGASQPCRSASRYPRSSLRERLDTSSPTCRGRNRLVSKGGKNAARLASSRVGVLGVSNCRDDGEKQEIRAGEGE